MDKCTEELKLRLSPEMLQALKDCAYEDDRSVSDYVRWIIRQHLYGKRGAANGEGDNGEHCPTQNNSPRKSKA